MRFCYGFLGAKTLGPSRNGRQVIFETYKTDELQYLTANLPN